MARAKDWIYRQDGYWVRPAPTGFYRVYWLEGGKPRSISTGCRVGAVDDAKSYAQRFIAGRLSKPLPLKPTVGVLLDRYKADCTNRKVRGLEGIGYAITALKERLASLEPEHLTKLVIQGYIAARRSQRRSDGTIRKELVSVLRSALSLAARDQIIAATPHRGAPPPPAPRNRLLSKDEIKAIYEAASADHIRLFIAIAFYTGARRGAILELEWARVDFKSGTIDFGEGHGRKHRATAPMNDALRDELERAHEIRQSEWVIEYHGRPVREVKTGFRGAVKRANLKGVTPHLFRHAVASHLAMAGTPLEEIADLLGANPTTVHRVYRKFQPSYLQRAVKSLSMETVK